MHACTHPSRVVIHRSNIPDLIISRLDPCSAAGEQQIGKLANWQIGKFITRIHSACKPCIGSAHTRNQQYLRKPLTPNIQADEKRAYNVAYLLVYF